MKENTVSKTIRLPSELVEYVELQEGSNFSSKLINLLDDVISGDAKRRAAMAEYDRQIDERRAKLQEVSHSLYDAMSVLQKLEKFCRAIESVVE